MEAFGGTASIEEITEYLCKEKHIIYDGYYKTIVSQVLLNDASKISCSKLTKKWSLEAFDEEKYLYVSDNRYFNTIREAMLELW